MTFWLFLTSLLFFVTFWLFCLTFYLTFWFFFMTFWLFFWLLDFFHDFLTFFVISWLFSWLFDFFRDFWPFLWLFQMIYPSRTIKILQRMFFNYYSKCEHIIGSHCISWFSLTIPIFLVSNPILPHPHLSESRSPLLGESSFLKQFDLEVFCSALSSWSDKIEMHSPDHFFEWP